MITEFEQSSGDEHCIGHGYLWWKYIDYERTYFLDDTLHGE